MKNHNFAYSSCASAALDCMLSSAYRSLAFYVVNGFNDDKCLAARHACVNVFYSYATFLSDDNISILPADYFGGAK